MDRETCQLAAETGCINWLWQLAAHQPVSMWPVSICSAAAAYHQLGTLKWLRSQKAPCPWDASTCTAAGKAGHLGVLQWLHRQQPLCLWDEDTCAAAASKGRIDILEWLRSQKPPWPWNQKSCAAAIHKGCMRTLIWLRNQAPPCPWTQAIEHSAADAHIYITTPLEWLQSHLPGFLHQMYLWYTPYTLHPCPRRTTASCILMISEVSRSISVLVPASSQLQIGSLCISQLSKPDL